MSTFLLMLAVLGYAPPSPPTSETVKATTKDLEQGWICVDKKYAKWKGKELSTGSACTASVEEDLCADKIALKLDACWLARDQVTLTGPDTPTLIVTLPPIAECPELLSFKGDILNKTGAVGTPPSAYEGFLYYEDRGHLVKEEVKAGELRDSEVLRTLKTTLLRTNIDGLCLVDKEKLLNATPPMYPVETPEPSVDRGVSPDLDTIKGQLDEKCWLINKKKRIDEWRRRRETICMAMDNKGGFTTIYRPRYLLPGQQLRLVVHVPSKVRLRARQEGTIGGESELDNQVSPTQAASPALGEEKLPDKTGATIQIWTFEGRAAGFAPIIIEEEAGKEAYRLEIKYPRTYLGSIRVGFGVVGGGAVGPQYTGVQRPGSSTYEIIEKTGGKLAFELVLAYSVYPEAMLGGRDYRQRLFTRNNWGIGPVVGVGAVSVSGGNFDVFKSLYIGLEFEPVRYFSVSTGPVMRRIDRLADGYQVGSAITDATVPTKERIGVGWFVMLNVTPQFMKTNYSAK